MTLRIVVRSLGFVSVLVALAVSLAALQSVATASANAADAAGATWSPLTPPWGAKWTINDACAFGSTDLAVAGGGGHIGITRSGGSSWSVVVPRGYETAVFTAIAFDTTGHGVVASGGLLLVTADWGITWRTPSYTGPAPQGAIDGVALQGSLVVAVGEGGMIMTSTDAGATWRTTASPTTSNITSVAIAGDGTAVAGSAAGQILVGRGGVWTLAGTVAGSVTSVAASADPVWGDGQPDLFATNGRSILGSDNGRTFASLPGLPNLSAQPWPSMAWLGVPASSLLIAGTPSAGFFDPSSRLWVPGPTGLGGTARAVAPAGQSVAYLLGIDGTLVRTLSAGQEPATVEVTQASILVGTSTSLAATVRVGAPGVVQLLQRVPGNPWETVQTLAWTSADWNRTLSFPINPSLTHQYLLTFNYGGAAVPLASAVKVIVTPNITTTRSTFRLRVGDVYQFSGSVTPALPGEKVEIFTDRGGRWRPVSQQGSVPLQNGRTWTSRRFGTPAAGSYHLRARLLGTATHGEAWSPVVTVTIRR